MIACKTTIGYGSPTKAGTNKVHGSPLGEDEIKATRKALGWKNPPFKIDAETLDSWRIAGLNSASERKEWQKRLNALDPEVKGEFERRMRGELPSGFDDAILTLKKEIAKTQPTLGSRNSSEMVLEVVNEIIDETVGGSADLTGSNNTKTSQMVSITPDDFSGRYLHYGIREHGMAAAMNGIALHGGLIPYSGGFLIFSDYCRPSIRLAALMGIRVIHVFTHDSIGLGEDGPTHQPVEQVAALRAIPNLYVMRPADTMETAECWQIALKAEKTPSAIALTRQKLPTLRTEYVEENLCAKGAYVLSDADDADVTIFASGSEVEIAMLAKEQLNEAGTSVRVVSVPCFELFQAQSTEYRKEIIGSSKVRIAVEAAVSQGWERFIGEDGIFIGMSGFGASGPYKELYEHFGITPEAITKAAQAKLK